MAYGGRGWGMMVRKPPQGWVMMARKPPQGWVMVVRKPPSKVGHAYENTWVMLLRNDNGSHAGITGGRYNSPGSDPITYFAGSATLAVLEVEQEQMAVGLNLFPAPPRLTYAIHVQGPQVLDLTNTAIRLQLGVSENDLLLPRPQRKQLNRQGVLDIPQMIGEAVRQNRQDIDGILYPAMFASVLSNAIPRLENLVLFMDPNNTAQPRGRNVQVAIHDPDTIFAKLGITVP